MVIDVYSGKCFLRAMLDKSSQNVLKGMRTIEDEFKENDYEIVSIITDNGKEFKNKEFLNHYKNIKDNLF